MMMIERPDIGIENMGGEQQMLFNQESRRRRIKVYERTTLA